jgi:tripartite-type tricarboxylate transporter receptor subunit TctC
MHFPILRKTALAFCVLGTLAAPHLAQAQEAYPSRPVRIIVPFAAGGGPDVQARQFAVPFGEALGGNVVVENRVGAAGIIAAEVVAQAPPDGYTLLAGSISQVVQKMLQPSAKFDPLKSYAPVSLLSTSPTVLVVPPSSTAKTVQELAAQIRAKPGQFNYSSGGIGTSAHLAGASFVAVLKLDAVHVPLRGSVEILQSLLGGHTQFAFPIAGTGIPNAKSGRLRALAVTSRERLQQLADVPTLFEVYHDETLVQESWSALWAPAGTPAAIVQKLHAATVKAAANPTLKGQVESQGSLSLSSKSPEELAEYMRKENTKWAAIIKMANVKAE